MSGSLGSIFRYLDTDGDGTGTKNANGNYSSVADDFYYESPSSVWTDVHRMIVMIEDTAGMQAEEYGNLGAALTNGIEVLRDTQVLTDGVNIKTNAEWARCCFDADVKSWGAGDEVLTARWTFAAAGEPLVLEPTERLIVRLNDDFTGLIEHYFMIQGVQYRDSFAKDTNRNDGSR